VVQSETGATVGNFFYGDKGILVVTGLMTSNKHILGQDRNQVNLVRMVESPGLE